MSTPRHIRLRDAPHLPRELVEQLETDTTLPNGADERFVGYGVMGVSFESGHVLALRRWVTSSIGPAYTSVWYRSPHGVWRFHADVDPTLACTRYAGAVADEALVHRVRLRWTSPQTLVVEVPAAALRWSMRMRSTPVTQLFDIVRPLLGERLLSSTPALRVLGAMARWGLSAGPVRLMGRMPNGQQFRIVPHHLWVVDDTWGELDGQPFGAPSVPQLQPRLGDFLIPRRPLFAIATAHFDAFDPARHRSVTSRADSPDEAISASNGEGTFPSFVPN